MSALDLHTIARRLGGDVSGRQVLAPGPGHSPGDRSLSIRLSHQSPTGFIVFSHSGDDFRVSRDYVAERLGMGSDAWRRDKPVQVAQVLPVASRQSAQVAPNEDNAARIARAVKIWNEAAPAQGTVVEHYLAGRGLELRVHEHEVIRFHPRCPWRDEAENRTIYVPAMIAAMRAIDGNKITAVHRTRLTPVGAKVDRRMLGQASGAAIKLDADDAVTMGLAIGEGIESCLAARQLGFQPVWALASAGAVAAFPVLSGVEALTMLGENDTSSDKAMGQCAQRWHAAGKEITIVTPNFGSDLNDALRGAA